MFAGRILRSSYCASEHMTEVISKSFERNEASKILVEAEKLLKTKKLFKESFSGVLEARRAISMIFRACGEIGCYNIARTYFDKAKLEDSERNPEDGFVAHFPAPYSIRTSTKVRNYCAPFRILNTSLCNLYLHLLVSSDMADLQLEEVKKVQNVLARVGFLPNGLTYQYLIEMHYRVGLDVASLWWALRKQSIQPTTISLRTPLSSIIVQHPDPCFVIDVLRVMFEQEVIEKNVVVNAIESLSRNSACMCDQILWVLFELEQSCVMEKVDLMGVLKSDSVFWRIYVKAAGRGENRICSLVLALMERHGIPRTHDVYGLTVYALARSSQLRDAFDVLNQMASQGLLDGQEAQRKFHVQALNINIECHYLYALATALSISVECIDDIYYYLEEKHTNGEKVSIHALDLIVLACARVHDEQRATETVDAYSTVFNFKPRVLTYLYLIQACGGKNKAKNQGKIFNKILQSGLRPTTAIYKLMIKQALVVDNIDEALELLGILGAEHIHDRRMWNHEENFSAKGEKEPHQEETQRITGHRVKLEPETLKLFIDKAVQKQDADLVVELLTRGHNEWNVLIDMKYLQSIEEALFQAGFKTRKIKDAMKLHETGYLKVPSR